MRYFESRLAEALEAPEDNDEFSFIEFGDAVHQLIDQLDTEYPQYVTYKTVLEMWTELVPDGWVSDDGSHSFTIGRDSTDEQSSFCFHATYREWVID